MKKTKPKISVHNLDRDLKQKEENDLKNLPRIKKELAKARLVSNQKTR